MKELENIKSDQTKIHNERQVKTEVRFLGSMTMHKGQHVFELDLVTREIRFATYDSVVYDLKKEGKRKKLIMKPKCMYCVAINHKNAERKFRKMLLELVK